MAWAELELQGQTLSPLSPDLRQGLIAVSALALVSFVASTALFLYLTYKLVVWRWLVRTEQLRQGEPPRPSSHAITDFTLGIEGIFTEGDPAQAEAAAPRDERRDGRSWWARSPPPNQFAVLIYNLFLADMHQSLAFLLNASWLWRDGIVVSTPTCFAQGLLVSTGDLSSSIFITTIAIHTYLSVVRQRRPSHRTVGAVVVCNWIFVYAISLLPVLVTRNGAERGGFFVRAGAWCWINKDYEQLRLATHYFFIFLALGVTSTLYVAIFVALRRQRSQAQRVAFADSQAPLTHELVFLVYPLIYVLCTLPLALGRIATMAGKDVPTGYFCFAGAIIAFNGAFDCLLFGTTRSAIIFGSASDLSSDSIGFKTFAFLKTPSARRYGNMIWIQGGGDGGRRSWRDNKMAGGWWPWNQRGRPWPRKERHQSTSQEPLGAAAIQMDMVTSVVVEVDSDQDSWPGPTRSKRTAASASVSAMSTDGVTLKE
ncbi:G protein-coupled glucose receptor regulating gpa2 domain-containing protein [Hirsutella rhossiliensis]|uniref:G protein-coupled glucose receptor regulating gpa2 domain-containing protein n=1 Tax=Hirsutella rhossiliensis TaxID=111463 RepID=A0A9P8MMA8_9HYPO|nr:G protein-coupled glucose receptor regulating gpa2 domain-containing protein [Hirsutella rhossiliensis]KAH0958843.1 G protein-coupled glucose receptor regulating gpa2 domain-containing protein [Hirsutella rhossiliensis]